MLVTSKLDIKNRTVGACDEHAGETVLVTSKLETSRLEINKATCLSRTGLRYTAEEAKVTGGSRSRANAHATDYSNQTARANDLVICGP